ncbi:immunoglobulin lambda-1 light chain-like [Lemur catta]|uniref:immunoglobulin lambda-1 light chain-like n=1 Tax=Lemur catta TaxID=9447 RepID=UPI001E26D3BA|nr:immunoglobulin lambda-1 light chain-like [Lemur catta]
MAWAPLLIPLLTLCSGSWAQSGLTQEASVSGSVGQKVTLSCTGNSNNVGSYTVGWYRQISRGAPKTVMLGTSRPSGIPDRFSGSKSGNTASLTISGLQPEDEADYYCSTWDYSLGADTPQGYTGLRACLEPAPEHATPSVITGDTAGPVILEGGLSALCCCVHPQDRPVSCAPTPHARTNLRCSGVGNLGHTQALQPLSHPVYPSLTPSILSKGPSSEPSSRRDPLCALLQSR